MFIKDKKIYKMFIKDKKNKKTKKQKFFYVIYHKLS